jgi:hypothetical protein
MERIQTLIFSFIHSCFREFYTSKGSPKFLEVLTDDPISLLKLSLTSESELCLQHCNRWILSQICSCTDRQLRILFRVDVFFEGVAGATPMAMKSIGDDGFIDMETFNRRIFGEAIVAERCDSKVLRRVWKSFFRGPVHVRIISLS